MNVDELTINFLNIIESKVTSIVYNTWFKDLEILDIDQNVVLIYVKGNFIKSNILKQNNYIELIENTLKEITGKDYSFELVTDIISPNPSVNEDEEDDISTINNEYNKINNNLNPNLRFDNFIIGDSNRHASVYALEVAKNPGKVYNPLFIYGRSGIGKTHLMHAIGNYIVEHSNKNVLYITSEQFKSDFTDMTRKNNNETNYELVEHFKNKYRNIDVLIIDDIQMLQDAKKTQDEFFQTFDFLHQLNKQIIISSDSSPNDLKLLEDRLKTRFYWGMTLDIKPPDYDLKLKILKNKIMGQEVGNMLSDEILEFIASSSPSDVRSLEGAINRLYAYISITQPNKIDLEFAHEALDDFLGSSMYMTNDIAKIRKIVAEYYDVTEESLKSKKRQAIINKARQVAMYIAKFTTEETIERIGREFNRDHATVIHATEKIEKQLKDDNELEKEIKEIKDKIIT